MPNADPRISPLLDDIYLALIRSQELRAVLIYKGARVLKHLLITTRYSEDIDATLSAAFVQTHKTTEDQKSRLTELITFALNEYFENSDPVRYMLKNVDLRLRPGRDVPDNWRMFAAFIQVQDAESTNTEGIIAQIDISIGEKLSESAITNISVGGHSIYAYSESRIAGEKLRAFLSCLPTYRKKIKQQTMGRRSKDLFDLAVILAKYPITNEIFWHQSAKEFLLACEFRKIDCLGLESFQEDWEITKLGYENDERLMDVPFVTATKTLEEIVLFLKTNNYIPLANPF